MFPRNFESFHLYPYEDLLDDKLPQSQVRIGSEVYSCFFSEPCSSVKYAKEIVNGRKEHFESENHFFPLSPSVSGGSTLANTEDNWNPEGTENASPMPVIAQKEPVAQPKPKRRRRRREPPRKTWDNKDDPLLFEMAIQYRNNWKRISRVLYENKNIKIAPKTLRRKYEDILARKKTQRAKFTHEDDLIIVKYVDLYGLEWNKVACHFTDKSATMIKNRFYSYIKKKDIFEELLQEAEERENRAPPLEEAADDMKGNVKKIMETCEDLPIFNQTHFELWEPLPEDQLFERVTSGGF